MRHLCIVGLILPLIIGCSEPPSRTIKQVAAQSDLKKVRSADVSILFVGNSHTSFHNLPNLVCEMIRFRHPEMKVYAHVVGVGFLEDAARNPKSRSEIETRPWKHVVLQGQKISVSGRFNYSRKEGIDLAKLAKSRGSTVLFYAEWGLKDVADDGARNEKIYDEMAQEAGVGVARVGRAWDVALTERPDMKLHSADGNHQSALGAFLTACAIYGQVMKESPAPLAAFPYKGASESDRKFLANAASKAFAPAK